MKKIKARVLPISSQLKPLVVQLRRLRIGEFLQTEEFDHIVLENDWDSTWHAAKKEIRRKVHVVIIGHHDSTIETDAFALWLHALYNDDLEQFENVL